MAGSATVEVLEGATPAIVDVPAVGLCVGSGDGADLIVACPAVAARHLSLEWRGDDLFAIDLGSAHGTRRDAADLVQPVLVRDGDELLLARTVLLRVSIAHARFGAPLSSLDPADHIELIPDVPADAQPAPVDLLATVEALYRAPTVEALAHEIVGAISTRLRPSRAAMLEVDPSTQRFRLLAVAGAADASFVSRTVVGNALARGIAYHCIGGASATIRSLRTAGAAAAVAAVIRTRDRRSRVVYMDSLMHERPVTWSHTLALQLLAVHAGAVFDGLAHRQAIDAERARFDQLRRYFSPTVAEHILSSGGAALSRPQQLRATVLFADMTAYTTLSERMRDRLDVFFGVVNHWLELGAHAVMAHGGTLDKFIGDGIMAVFGAPFATPLAPLQAVRCAVEMRERMRATAHDGAPLPITAGINTGTVLAGSVGTARRLEYTVIGDAVNVAAHLQEIAGPDDILLGEDTAREVSDDVELAHYSAEPVRLKNRSEPVHIYRVVRLR